MPLLAVQSMTVNEGYKYQQIAGRKFVQALAPTTKTIGIEAVLAGPVPDKPPVVPAEPPGTLKPGVTPKPGEKATVWRRKPTSASRQQPAKIEDEPGMTDRETRDMLAGKRHAEEEVPHDPSELETGYQKVDTPDRFHWSMTEEDLVEIGVREFPNLPPQG